MKEKHFFQTILIMLMSVCPALSYLSNVPPVREEIVIPAWREPEPEISLKESPPKFVIATLNIEGCRFWIGSYINSGTLQIGIYPHDWQQTEQEVSDKATSFSVNLK